MFEQLEQIRKKEVKKILTALGIAIVLVVFLQAVSRYGKFQILMFGFFASVVVIALLIGSSTKKYTSAYKQMFLSTVLEKEFEDVKMNFDQGFSADEIRDGHLVTLYDRFYSDDYISGKYNNIFFECSDIKVQDVVRSGKTTTVVTRFQGMYMKVNLKKQFSGWTVVREKEFLDNGNPRGFFSGMPQLEKVNFESEQFNQKFSVYSSDGEEAFYLLTPRFMDKMMEIEARYEGRCLFGFLNGQLHMAIDSRVDHFSVDMFEKVDKNKINEHQGEINMIKGLVELVARECEETCSTF